MQNVNASVSTAPLSHVLEYTGVNISGGEWGYIKTRENPVYGQHYMYPSDAEIAYFVDMGMNVIRLPFTWEIIQPSPMEAFQPSDVERLSDAVARIVARGAVAILDPHNYACYRGKPLGTPDAPTEWFADFWRRLAMLFANNPLVWFGLVNEPHIQSATDWLSTANAAVAAIRSTGAANLILAPGTNWDGAHSWLRSGNDALLGLHDPMYNWIVEAHQYFDVDSSGTHPEVVSETIGSERLVEFTTWCRTNGKRAFLGEFGASALGGAGAAVRNLLDYMESNSDVWHGFAWWAAGAIWDNYMFGLDPSAEGADSVQMGYLTGHLQPRSD